MKGKVHLFYKQVSTASHDDTVQLTDGNKTVLSNKQMQTGFGELRDELHQIVRIA